MNKIMNKIEFTLNFDEDLDKYITAHYPQVMDYKILSKSLDARGAPRGKKPVFHYILEVKTEQNDFLNREEKFSVVGHVKFKPIIIGAGPAGLFCALRFSEYGIPCVIIERGDRASERMKKIARHWRYGEFNEETNVCFGEGGAGLFSDGKLITRIKSDYIQYVMNKFVQFGAPKLTAYESNPHLGSNKIRAIITLLTDYLKGKGCDFFFNERVDELLTDKDKIIGVKTNLNKRFYSESVILSTGHSAKNIYHECARLKVKMKPKDFAVGVRIEHPRKHIDSIQHGNFCSSDVLGAARYRLSHHNQITNHGTYSFCMCPGGYVLSSGSDRDGIVVNGMSNFSRNSPWSNSALVVSVNSQTDFENAGVLSGLAFQETIEKKAYEQSKTYAQGRQIPAITLKEFLENKCDGKKALPKNSCPSGVFKSNFEEIFPQFITSHLRESFASFDKQIKGFAYDQALLLAPETRTSSPLTIERDRLTFESISHKQFYPCGEGAGHAGGITSAAVDGVKVAMSILSKYYSVS